MKIQFQDGSSVDINSAPSGTIMLHAGDTPPDGYLPCNGAVISRTTYVKLFEVLGTRYGAGDGSGTFGLPNVEDRFPRFAGNGLVVGDKQEDAIRNITGTFWYTHTAFQIFPTGAFVGLGQRGAPGNTIEGGDASQAVKLDASLVVPTADENRPKSIVFNAYIKY